MTPLFSVFFYFHKLLLTEISNNCLTLQSDVVFSYLKTFVTNIHCARDGRCFCKLWSLTVPIS